MVDRKLPLGDDNDAENAESMGPNKTLSAGEHYSADALEAEIGHLVAGFDVWLRRACDEATLFGMDHAAIEIAVPAAMERATVSVAMRAARHGLYYDAALKAGDAMKPEERTIAAAMKLAAETANRILLPATADDIRGALDRVMLNLNRHVNAIGAAVGRKYAFQVVEQEVIKP